MFRVWKWIIVFSSIALLLTGCSQTIEERSDSAVEAAKNAFFESGKESTIEVDGVKLYKPTGFTVSENSDAQNILFKQGDEAFILFINPNESSNSQLFYDLLKGDTTKDIIAEQSFNEDNRFGFAAVVKSANDKVELIASIGGAKITTIATDKKIVEQLTRMMEIVRSINQE